MYRKVNNIHYQNNIISSCLHLDYEETMIEWKERSPNDGLSRAKLGGFNRWDFIIYRESKFTILRSAAVQTKELNGTVGIGLFGIKVKKSKY